MAVNKEDRRTQIFPSIKNKYIDVLGGEKRCKELAENYLNLLAEEKIKQNNA